MRKTLLLLVLAVATACQKPAVVWQEPTSVRDGPPPGAPAPAIHPVPMRIDASKLTPINGTRMCVRSMRFSIPTIVGMDRPPEPTKPLYAAWWSVRNDSNAVLFAARSEDQGTTWSTPAVVDSGDVSRRGCDRPAPAVASVGDYVYTAYSMQASEGTGVFETHSMDGGKTFHSTVPVMYGDREVAVALSADSQFVAVAYEEPNGTRHRVAVSISHSLGHLFEMQTIASTDVEPAYLPSVFVQSNVLMVDWTTRPGCNQAGCPRLSRTGLIN